MHIPLLIGLWTGQREGDVLRLIAVRRTNAQIKPAQGAPSFAPSWPNGTRVCAMDLKLKGVVEGIDEHPTGTKVTNSASV
jgi:hypothetical protein